MFSPNKTNLTRILAIMCFIILPTGFLQAQNVLTTRDLGNISQKMHGAGIMTFQSTKYIGSPFLTKFQHGYIIMNGGVKSQPLLLRYNMHTNNVQYSSNKRIYRIPAKKLNGFVIKTTDGNLIFRNGFKTGQEDINQNTLLRLIYNGNIKFLAHYSSTLMKNIATYGTATKKEKFTKHTHYYLQTADGKFHEVDLKRKDILEVLTGHKKEVKNYAEKNHLSFKNMEDLKKILTYYDHSFLNLDS